MTAVLSPTDAFRRDVPSLSHHDDPYNQDWRQKYTELSETLAETRADLEEFQQSSKELEEEMNLEIERTERAQQEQKAKTARVEAERDEWKSKFMTLQTTHNTATTSLQRELDTLRQQQQTYKVQMRELEMGNDDLERNERAVTSSLADIESKYTRVLEEKILLEHELLDKANLEEESQRLKDELRDANEEISNLTRQLEHARSVAPASSLPSSPGVESADRPPFPVSLDEDLLRTPPPPDLLLSDLTPAPAEAPQDALHSSPSPPPTPTAPMLRTGKSGPATGQSALLSRAGFPSNQASGIPLTSNSPSSLPRSSTLPSLSPARTTPHTAHGQTFTRSSARTPGSNLPIIQGSTSRSKGVQMISALRSRVQTTHQRLIPGIPRLRMGSVNGRSGPPPQPIAVPSGSRSSTSSSERQGSKGEATSADERGKRTSEESSRDGDRRPGAQSPGWVLIQTQDDSPFPAEKKDAAKERRRASSPLSPTGHTPIPSAFRPLSSMASSRNGPPGGIPRRPQSRLSLTGADGSAIPTGAALAASSSIPSLSSRPSTPTFLPVPTFHHQGGHKRSTDAAPASFAASTYNPRRSSLGMHPPPPPKRSVSPGPTQSFAASSHKMNMSTRERPTSVPALPRSTFGLSQAMTSKVTALNQSRVGKSGASGRTRRSTGGSADDTAVALSRPEKTRERGRLRAGSAANSGSRTGS